MDQYPKLTVYTKDNCVQCHATTRHLDKVGYPFETLDANEHARDLQNKGFMQAPVVVAHYKDGTTDSWAGYNPGKLNNVVHS